MKRAIGHAVEACISPHAWIDAGRGEPTTIIIAAPSRRGKGLSAVVTGPLGTATADKRGIVEQALRSLSNGHPVYIEVRDRVRWTRIILMRDEPFHAAIAAPGLGDLVLLESRPISRTRLWRMLKPCETRGS